MSKLSVLVIEDNAEENEIVGSALCNAHFRVESCIIPEDVFPLLSDPIRLFDVVVIDLLLGSDFEAAFAIISHIRKTLPSTTVIVLSSHGTAEFAVRAVKAGAYDFVEKPKARPYTEYEISSLLLPAIRRALESNDQTQLIEREAKLALFSENELIDLVLIPLLNKMQYLGVQRNAFHGPGEYGRDIMPFYKYGDFNERIYYAAQVKVGDVSAKSGAGSSVYTLMDQARAILSVSFVDKFDATRKRVDRALLVCSGRISSDARHLLEEFSEGRREIILVEGDDLIRLLKANDMIAYFDRISIPKGS